MTAEFIEYATVVRIVRLKTSADESFRCVCAIAISAPVAPGVINNCNGVALGSTSMLLKRAIFFATASRNRPRLPRDCNDSGSL